MITCSTATVSVAALALVALSVVLFLLMATAEGKASERARQLKRVLAAVTFGRSV